MSSLRRSLHLRDTCEARASTLGSSIKERICARSATALFLKRHPTYPQAELVWKNIEWIFLQERADKLVYKAQLLAGAEFEDVSQRSRPLRTSALGEVEAKYRKVLVIFRIYIIPVGSAKCWTGGCGRGGW